MTGANRSSSRKILKRFAQAFGALAVLAAAIYYVAETFRENLVFFATPTELLNTKEKSQGDLKKQHKRLGGLVKKGSVRVESAKERHLVFTVTDLESDVVVQYRGFLPDLFREGQGVVAQGTFDPRTKIFTATKIMAKHDETYKPPEVRRALDKATLSETLSAVDMGGTKNNTDSKDAEK